MTIPFAFAFWLVRAAGPAARAGRGRALLRPRAGRGDSKRRGLGAGLDAQPPGLAAGPAHPPRGGAGGAVQREPALLGSVGELLPVRLAGELGELVHDGHLLSYPVMFVWLGPLSPPAAAVAMRDGEQEGHRIEAQD